MTDKKDTSHIVKIGITAGVIGAAAGAAGVILSDKNNRQKVTDRLDKVKKWSDKTVEEWKARSEETLQEAGEAVGEVKEDVKQDLKDVSAKTDESKKEYIPSSKQVN